MRIQGHEQLDRQRNISKIAKVNGQAITKGEMIKGEVLDIQQKDVLIQLESGMKMTATLTQDIELSIGQRLMFQVKDANPEQVILRPMLEALFNPKDAKLMQALDQAGVTPTEKNMQIVQELISRNMPVDKKTLNQVMRLAYKFQDVSMDRLLFMIQKDIPVTKENISQLNNLIQHQNGIKQEMMDLGQQMLQGAANDTDTRQEFVRIMTSPIHQEVASLHVTSASIEQVVEKQEQQITLSDVLPKENIRLTNLLPKQMIQQINDDIKAMLGDKGNAFKPLTGDMTFEQLEAWMTELDLEDDQKSALNKNITTKVLEGAIDQSMFLSKDALKEPKLIQNYYNQVYDKLIRLIQSKTVTGEKSSELMKSVGKVKQNLEFMHQINQNYQYVQLPFKFDQTLANSELYIFENKKELKSKGKIDAISALLRLDYLNLGHLDIYVKKQDKMVECKFYVEDDDKQRQLDAHIDKLSKRLDSFGYKITGMSVTLKKDSFSVMEDFLQQKSESAGVKRYSFDMRV